MPISTAGISFYGCKNLIIYQIFFVDLMGQLEIIRMIIFYLRRKDL